MILTFFVLGSVQAEQARARKEDALRAKQDHQEQMVYIHIYPPRVCVCLLCVFAVVREEVVVAARKEREKVITDDMTVGRYR